MSIVFLMLTGAASLCVLAAALFWSLRAASRRAGLSGTAGPDWSLVLTRGFAYLRRPAWRRHVVRRFSLFGVIAALIAVLVVLDAAPASGRALSRAARMIGLDPIDESLVLMLALFPTTFIAVMLFSYAHQHAVRVCAARGRICPRCAYGLAELAEREEAEGDEIVCPECGYRTTPGELVRDWQTLAYLPSEPFQESPKGQ